MLCSSLDGREFGGEWIHVYVWLSPFPVHLQVSQHWLLIRYTPTQNKVLKKKIASPQTFLELPVISRVLQSLSLKGAQQNILR